MSDPETSIVIRTFNEEKYLGNLLAWIKRQSYHEFEVIVVDSGSMDRTRDVAIREADRVLRIDRHDFTFGYSLNEGIRTAKGKYIAIASGHTAPLHDNWLRSLIEPLKDERTAMVYGRQLGSANSKISEVYDLERIFGSEKRFLQPPHFFANNANSAIRKDLWEQHNFDATVPGLEDIEWAKFWMERGYRVVYEPEAALYHIHEENWRQVRRRYYREALAARWIGVKGQGHILIDLIREIRYLAEDLVQILWPSDDDVSKRQKIVDQFCEIFFFRSNKAIGTIKGLLDGAVMQNPIKRDQMFFDRTCRAVNIHGPGKAVIEEIGIPELKPGDVLIRIAYEGICNTDIEIFEGTLGYYKNGIAKYPIVPGHEFSGRIVATGTNINHLKEHDAVVVECIQSCGSCKECLRSNWIGCSQRAELGVIGRNGGYSEYVIVPGRFVHRLPENFDLRMACLCEPLAVVLKGLKRLSGALHSDTTTTPCAVLGAGPLGHLCAKVLMFQGHPVTVFDRNPLRLSCLKGSSIQVSEDQGMLADFGVLVEATGDQEALESMMDLSPAGAKILLLGLPYAHRKFSFESIVAYDKTIVGSVGSSADDFESAIDILPKLNLDQFTTRIFSFENFQEAWDVSRTGKYLKVLLEFK